MSIWSWVWPQFRGWLARFLTTSICWQQKHEVVSSWSLSRLSVPATFKPDGKTPMPVWLSSNKKTRSHPISLVDYQLALSSHFTNLSIIDKKSHKTSLLQTLQPTFFCSPFFSGGQKKMRRKLSESSDQLGHISFQRHGGFATGLPHKSLRCGLSQLEAQRSVSPR